MTCAKEAVTFARDSIFEREAVADERAILRDALRRGMGETSYRDIRQEFDRRRNAGEFRSVQGMKHDSGRSFTTPETIAAERANVRYVLEGRNAVEPIMTTEQAREQANTRSFLNDSQRRVVEEVLTSSDRIHGLQGLAGSGKTTTLQTIREGAEASGYIVEGFAPTSKAAGQLREAGIEATTLQSFLARDQNQTLRTLSHRSDMTGADRTWAARYNPGDILQYNTGSKAEGIERGSFATVQSVDAHANTLTVSLEGGSSVTYDPRRLKGVNVFREVEREFATGDRVQFTAPTKILEWPIATWELS